MSNTKSIKNLFGLKFNIPAYQRGYRWGEIEVTDLLNDLKHFFKNNNNGEFYCLQPIVLHKKNNSEYYEVLDGQQRLTTIYLILTYLEKNNNKSNHFFSLNYETRKNSENFINNKEFINVNSNEENIDYYHITKAYQYIVSWFENNKDIKIEDFESLLITEDKKSVKFIWYEIEKDENLIDVFIRLNIGKIPLTNAELCKALLLQKDKYPQENLEYIKLKLKEIASEWDTIESTLQNDEFWFFLNKGKANSSTRIDFILDIIANKINDEKKYFDTTPVKHSTFLILSKYIDSLSNNTNIRKFEDVKSLWDKIIECFDYFNAWFSDRELYHYIGYYLCYKNDSINDLIEKSYTLTKSKFIKIIKEKIYKIIEAGDKNSIGSLLYENEDETPGNTDMIKKVLLLHNVFTTLNYKKNNTRFSFNSYKNTNWSIEHIHARNSQEITDSEQQKKWLNDHIVLVENNSELNKEVKEVIANISDNKDKKQNLFNEISNKIYNYLLDEKDTSHHDTHSLNNLCLLDKNTNSKLNNSIFAIKRVIISEVDYEKFIPICTRNVFLKKYTQYPDNNIYWSEKDKKAYLNDIQKIIGLVKNQ